MIGQHLLPLMGGGWHHLPGGSHNPSYEYPLSRGVMIVTTHHLMYIHVVRYHHLDRGGWVDTPRSKTRSMTRAEPPPDRGTALWQGILNFQKSACRVRAEIDYVQWLLVSIRDAVRSPRSGRDAQTNEGMRL